MDNTNQERQTSTPELELIDREPEPQELTPQELTPRQFIRKFAKAATIRAVRTMAQTAASLMGAKALISDVDWKALISATVMSGVLSILTSLYTGLPETEDTNQTAKKAA